jgi:hypothetical protein
VRPILAAVVLAVLSPFAVATDDFPYLLRIEHYVSGEQSCALLQKDGAFHLEQENGAAVKVFEGKISPKQLTELETALNHPPLAGLSQEQVEEPLLRTRFDKLQVDIFREGKWQELMFRSSDSQEMFKQSLRPLLRWLDHLPSSAHRELSEDEGKNNCLPPGKIELKSRGATPRSITPKIASDQAGAPLHSIATGIPEAGAPQLLLQLHSLERKSGSARERCLVVAEDGNYEVEDRAQRAGEKVNATSAAGALDSAELSELHNVLENRDLANIHHREPPQRSPVVPMLGDMTQIFIRRNSGEQQIVLSSWFGRPVLPSFYAGDADPHRADALLQFIRAHVASSARGKSHPNARHVCKDVGEP